MKVLVTGSSGFVGSHLVEKLISKNYKVRVLLRKQSKSKYNDGLKVEKVYADYNNKKSLIKALDGISIIYHVGGVTKALKKTGYFKGNTQTTKNLLDAAILSKIKPKRFLLVSSLAAAGPAADPDHAKSENDLCNPVETYGQSKLSAELLCLNYIDKIPVTIVRPPTVYGPRDTDCFELFNQAEKHINLFFGNSKKYTSIIHVNDLVDGIILAAESSNSKNKTYFISNDKPITWNELQETIKKASEKWSIKINVPSFTTYIAALFGEIKMLLTKKPVLINSQKIKLSKPAYWICSNKKAKSELKFKQKVSIYNGVKQTLKWYRQNKWL